MIFLRAALERPGRVFYGWWVLAACSVIGALNAGFYYYGFGAFFTPLINEFGWSRAQLSGASSIARVEGGVVAPLVGMVIDRFGPRRVMLVGIPLFGVGFALISRVNDLLTFYLLFIFLVSTGNSLGTSFPPMAAVNNWFARRRGIATGLLMAGYGIGGGTGAFFLGWLITAYGWRNAAVASGAIILVVGVIAAAFVRRRPEDYGRLPDGDLPLEGDHPPMGKMVRGSTPGGSPSNHYHSDNDYHSEAKVGERGKAALTTDSARPGASEARDKRPEPLYSSDFTVRQALACSGFWFLSAVVAIRQMVSSAVAVHEAPFLVDRGYGLAEATAILGITVYVSVLGRVLWGYLGDRIDKRKVLALCHALMAIGLVIMTTISDIQNPLRVVAFIGFYGLGYGGTIALSIAMIGEYFGRRAFATIQGCSNTVGMFGTVFGPLFAGVVFDMSQSYVFALLTFAAIVVIGLPLFWMIRRPQVPNAGGLLGPESNVLPAEGG